MFEKSRASEFVCRRGKDKPWRIRDIIEQARSLWLLRLMCIAGATRHGSGEHMDHAAVLSASWKSGGRNVKCTNQGPMSF